MCCSTVAMRANRLSSFLSLGIDALAISTSAVCPPAGGTHGRKYKRTPPELWASSGKIDFETGARARAVVGRSDLLTTNDVRIDNEDCNDHRCSGSARR